MAYQGLNRAQLSFDYLHTNSTTHEFLFGALAEIVDNARDAKSTKINIFTVPAGDLRGGFMLCFLDDGEGMSSSEAADIVTFGKSAKRSNDVTMIGMYGNGLKSGSMRIGNDMIVFTKKGPKMTCVFLSRTFHEQEDLGEIIVPMPSFDSQTRKPIATNPKDREKHSIEMSLVLKYSPFKTESAFFQQFDKISESGTLVIIYNVKLLDSGDPELDIKSFPDDIRLSNPDTEDFNSDEGLKLERRSFRAYASILYVDPRMRIYLQGKKVQTKRLVNCLYKPRLYHYSSSRFRNRSEAEVEHAQKEAVAADNRAKEAESKAVELESKLGRTAAKDKKVEVRKAQATAADLRKEASLKKQIANRKQKSLKAPKTLSFIFGMNLENRSEDGVFIYNCSRLIKMYQRVGPQVDGGLFCGGVVGVVDIPYMVLEPTHNKQDFADAKEYRFLLHAMGDHILQYWKDVNITAQGVAKFWEGFGYLGGNWKDKPSDDVKYKRRRAMQIQSVTQCNLCLKWRMLPFSSSNVNNDYPDEWICSMNSDPGHNRCSHPEEKLSLPEGVLKKDVKTKEQREKDLAEEIKKKTDQLQKMKKTKAVTSSRQVRKQDEESEESEEEEDDEEEEEEERRPKRRSTRDVRNTSFEESKKVNEASRKFVHEPPPAKVARTYSSPQRASARISSPPRSAKMSAQRSPTQRAAEAAAQRPPAAAAQRAPAAAAQRDQPQRASATSTVNQKKTSLIRSPLIRAPAPSTPPPEDEEEEDRTPKQSEQSKNSISDNQIGTTVNGESGSQLGTKVEVEVDGKWMPGVVVETHKRLDKWKVKFDGFPQDRHDKWYQRDATDVRLVPKSSPKAGSADADHTQVQSITMKKEATDNAPEVPTSSTSVAFVDDVANGYRTCLRYFLPPQWKMDKDTVSSLSVEELANFPLDDFFDHYEQGLRKLVSSFQTDATARQAELETTQGKLSNIRKMISKLLKSINEEFEIDPECDTDQVDELLEMCVKQALEQQDK